MAALRCNSHFGLRGRSCLPQQRGATLTELAISLVILSIIILAGIAVFSLNQNRIIRAMNEDVMVQVGRNEVSRVLSIPYDDVQDETGRIIEKDGHTYTVDLEVTVHNHTQHTDTAELKEVLITISNSNGTVREVRVLRSP